MMNYDLPWKTPVTNYPIINIKNQSTSCHHSSLNTQGKGDGVGGTEAGTNSHLDLPFLCALTVSRKTSNSSSRSLGPAMFSGWNCTLTTPRVWTVFTSKCQHFRWQHPGFEQQSVYFKMSTFLLTTPRVWTGCLLQNVNISADTVTAPRAWTGCSLQNLSTFLPTTPRVWTGFLLQNL